MVERIKSKDNTENIGICFEPLSPGCCFLEAWEQEAHKALELDDNDPYIHSALTNLYVMQRQYDKAIASAERALALGPGAARSQSSMGTALAFSCRFNEAIPSYEEAIRLDPYPPGTLFRLLGGA
jgi:tetratricopeptide (TPR) repeat protein